MKKILISVLVLFCFFTIKVKAQTAPYDHLVLDPSTNGNGLVLSEYYIDNNTNILYWHMHVDASGYSFIADIYNSDGHENMVQFNILDGSYYLPGFTEINIKSSGDFPNQTGGKDYYGSISLSGYNQNNLTVQTAFDFIYDGTEQDPLYYDTYYFDSL